MLKTLTLQNFRSYKKKSFEFNKGINLIMGQNGAGKTNILEAIYLLSNGKSFRTSNFKNIINLDSDFGRIKAETINLENENLLEINFLKNNGINRNSKKYFLNGVSRFLKNFINNFPVVIFKPDDINMITGTPSVRRNFLDSALISDTSYFQAKTIYDKALKQRNALLEQIQKTGKRNQELFEYWDNILIENGRIITQFRSEFIAFINASKKNVFDIKVEYDKSEISKERLLQYQSAEIGTGNTLVGPQRDNLKILGKLKNSFKEMNNFGSNGQNRMSVMQLITLQFEYIKNKTNQNPILLLDDIFSELDLQNTKLIIEKTKADQTIITSTQKEIESINQSYFSKILNLD